MFALLDRRWVRVGRNSWGKENVDAVVAVIDLGEAPARLAMVIVMGRRGGLNGCARAQLVTGSVGAEGHGACQKCATPHSRCALRVQRGG